MIALLLALACGGREAPRHLIVLCVDDLRADALGTYAVDARETPNLDAFLASAVAYPTVLSPTSGRRPGVATLMTGLRPHRHGLGVESQDLSSRVTSLAQVLSPAFFETAAVLGVVPDEGAGLYRGFDVVSHGDERRPATEVTDTALAWLDEQVMGGRDPDRLFLWVEYADLLPPRNRPAGDVRRYNFAVGVMDDEIRRFLERFDASPLSRDAAVVLISPRGSTSALHAARVDGAGELLDDITRVPFAIRVPTGRSGQIAGLVGTEDVMPTLLDLMGIGVGPIDGRSMWGRVVQPRDVVVAEASVAGADAKRPSWINSDRWQMARSNRHKLLWDPLSGDMELYDLVTDSNELWNALDDSPERTGLARPLLDAILQRRREAEPQTL